MIEFTNEIMVRAILFILLPKVKGSVKRMRKDPKKSILIDLKLYEGKNPKQSLKIYNFVDQRKRSTLNLAKNFVPSDQELLVK
jgi:hypothetical protein